MTTSSRLGGIAVAMANRNYRLYTYGAIPSLLGTWIQRMAMGWLAWELTKSGTCSIAVSGPRTYAGTTKVEAGTPARSTWRSVNRFKEEPACSNSAQKTMDVRIKNIAAKIRSRSSELSLETAVNRT